MRTRIPKPVTRFFIIFLVLCLLRVPFYATHHIQEDAYISLRCAENLAENGVYGFNTGERVSSSTSHLYVFLAALVRLIVGHTAFIPVLLILNTILLLLGLYFLSRAFIEEPGGRIRLWVMAAVLPISLLISFTGMETSLLIFMIGTGLYLMLLDKNSPFGWMISGLLPWIRPDAIAFALILIFWQSMRKKRVQWSYLLALGLGIITLLLFNQAYFGTFLQQSINAKLLMRHSFSPGEFLNNLVLIFLGGSDGGLFAPIRSKYFDAFGIVFFSLVITGMVLWLWSVRNDRSRLFTGLAAATMSLAVPVAYALGGVLYQWYFWPSTLVGFTFILALLAKFFSQQTTAARIIWWATVIALVAGIGAQWVYSYAWGVKEYAYRGGIGVWLREHSMGDERILLEPAGYIPYYSGLYTYDEVGLVTPQVVNYRRAYDQRWWMEFVMDFQPDWIIQRGHILEGATYQGYRLSGDEQDWFEQNYNLAASFSFKPEQYAKRSFLIQLLTLGEADDYFVFHLVK